MDERLLLEAIVTCPECTTDIDTEFQAAAGVTDRQELIESPTKEMTCPNCGHKWVAEWEGWIVHEDAG